jgi:subtilisin family serine protease
MKAIIALLVLVTIATATVTFTKAPNVHERIPDSYIIKLRANITDASVTSIVNRMSTVYGLEVTRNWKIGSFRAVAVAASEEKVIRLLVEDETIERIDENAEVHLGQECFSQNTLAWNLARVSDKERIDSDQDYIHPTHGGSGIHSYVIDTGIRITHTEFSGRATWGANFVDTNNVDCNGHGTHVASTVGGVQYGIAKAVNLVAVKVLSCAGSGSWIGVIDGVAFTASDCAQKNRKCTANMSLGGGFIQSVNDAVTAAVATGVIFAVAAGNENRDACLVSPASAEGAICVGATALGGTGGGENQSDLRSSFSNYGTCTTLFAPGSAIPGAWITNDNALNTISGTSMASPHVAGVASLLLQDNPGFTPQQITDLLVSTATRNVIQLNCINTVCNNSPNLLLHSSCE